MAHQGQDWTGEQERLCNKLEGRHASYTLLEASTSTREDGPSHPCYALYTILQWYELVTAKAAYTTVEPREKRQGSDGF